MKTYVLFIDKETSKQYAEECAKSYFSCGMPAQDLIMFKGICDLDNKQLMAMTGYHIHTDLYKTEYCSTVGHMGIWKAIVESNEIGVVLEHDAIVKGNYSNIVPDEGEILFLGPRVVDREDYQFPQQYANDFDLVKIHYNHGAHAYMITPNTARKFLSILEEAKEIFMPIDGLLGLKNMFNMPFRLVDPAVVVAEIGKRKSFNFEQPDATNRLYTKKFLEGVKDRSKLPQILDFKFFSEENFSSKTSSIIEALQIAKFDSNDKLDCLEIGYVRDGRSTCWFIENLLLNPKSKMGVLAFFDSKEMENHFLYNLSLTANCNKTQTYKGETAAFFPYFMIENMRYDFIYVNTNPNAKDIINDGVMCYHLLRNNGMMIFNNSNIDEARGSLSRLIEILDLNVVHVGNTVALMKSK